MGGGASKGETKKLVELTQVDRWANQHLTDNDPVDFKKRLESDVAKLDIPKRDNWKRRILTLTNDKGRNLLHLACFFCAEKNVQFLCNQFKLLGLDLDARDKFGYTAAMLTCIHLSETDSLVAHGNAQGGLAQSFGRNQAQEKKVDITLRTKILEELTKSGSKWVEHSYHNTYNPLHWAIVNGDDMAAFYIVKQKPEFSSLQ